MTVRFDPNRLYADRVTLSKYPGHGILFENLLSDGENGGSPLINDGGVAGDEVRWELLSTTSVAEINEDGSAYFEVGNHVYRSFINGQAVGDFTATVNPVASEIPAGSGSDTLTATTGAIGYRQSVGNGSDTATLSMTGFGSAPSEIPAGFGSDTLTVAISGVGYMQTSGSASDSATLTTAATGYRQSRGTGSDTLTLSIGGVTLSRAVVLTYNTSSSERYAVSTASQRVEYVSGV